MKKQIRRWFGDERGASFEGIALSVSIVAVGFVASADVLDYMTKKHGEAIGGTVRDVASVVLPSMATPGIDYTPTASVTTAFRQPVILDPCTGQRK